MFNYANIYKIHYDKAMIRKSKYQTDYREKMVGANLYEDDVEAVFEL
ncbi:MAG: hypothetical protein K0S41_3304 [Anaerocolumna sp.]|jgi:hypothetical protein|nr:hypothetical protein [Anaerocolumna sp.]